jgi:hypothetical protein
MTRRTPPCIAALLSSLIASAALGVAASQAAIAQDDADASELEALRAEVEELRRKLPSQSHTMEDVDYHFANLWFAGEAENWPLAEFYLNETVSHIGWATRVVPVRPTSNGPLDLRPIFETMRNYSLAELRDAVEAEDVAAFGDAYRHAMEECHACHVAAEKPYLRPHIPEAPPARMIDMTPPAADD